MNITALTHTSGILLKVIQYYGVKQNYTKKKYFCPFHEESDASFMTYKDGTKFKCFGCGVQGDAVDFIMRKENLSFHEAEERLRQISGNFVNVISNKIYSNIPIHKKETEIASGPDKIRKIHIRKIGDFAKDNRFIRMPEEDTVIREAASCDIEKINRMGKKFSLENVRAMGVKISEIPYGLAFPGENEHLQMVYNPENKNISLHLEGRTDWITAGEMSLHKHYCLISEHNKSSKIYIEPKTEHIFILDRDDFPEEKIKNLIGEIDTAKLKFVRLPDKYKDLSDAYNELTKENVINLINDTRYFAPKKESNIIEKDDGYYLKLTNGNIKRITNFSMELVCRFYSKKDKTHSESTRLFRLKMEDEVIPKYLTDKEWVDLGRFKESMASEGEYNFTGSKRDFDILRSHIIDTYPDRKINEIDLLGKIDDKTWIFENGIIYDNKFYPYNENEIAFIDDKTGFSVKDNRYRLLVNAEGNIDLRDLFFTFFSLYGEIAYKIFGFAAAIIFRDKIAKKFKSFPLLYFTGKSESGKSKASDLLASMLACNNLTPFNYSSTVKGINRILARHKNFVVRINEYNSNDDKRDSFLMSLFDIEGYLRAETDNTLKTKDTEINSGVVVMSEVLPNRESVINRLIHCNFNNVEKQSGLFNELYDKKDELSNFLFQAIERLDADSVISSIDKLKNDLYKELPGKFTRAVDDYSIIFGSLLEFFKCFGIEESDNPLHPNCIHEIKETIKKDINKVCEMSKDTSNYKIVFEHFKSLYERNTHSNFIYTYNGELIINLNQCYQTIKEIDNKGAKEIRLSKTDVKSFIEETFKVKYLKSIYRQSDQGKTGGYRIPLAEIERVLGIGFD
jgi:hypothetical protein